MQTAHDQDTFITAINPATEQLLGKVKISSPEEIDHKVQMAHVAAKRWRDVPLRERLQLIAAFRDIVYRRREELSETITRETGKPLCEALVSEIFGVLETCVWLSKNARRWLSPEKIKLNALFLPGKSAYNVYEPLGVIAVISPWNYPFSIPVSSMLTALVAGNAVVLKPSPKTALTAEAIVRLFAEAQFPDGLVSLVQGDRGEAEHLIASPINRIMFTGSTTGGKAIAGLAAKRLIPLTLELGGKHAAIVLEDSDPEAIAGALTWAAFTNAGQACASIERLYVVKSIAKPLTEAIAARARRLRMGDGMLPDTDIGPLIDASQLIKLKEQVDEAVAQGATLLAGGRERRDLGGYFFEPTVLSGVTQSMRVVQEEIFGPVLPIIEVVDEHEAIRFANDSKLGLGASVWTPNLERAQSVARQIEAGMVWINDGLYTHISPDAPWGGIKDSGYGRMHSAAELRDLVYVKSIGMNAQRGQDWNYPYSPASLEFIRSGVEVLHGAIGDRIRAIKSLVRFMLGKP